MKDGKSKEKVIIWLRSAVELNLDKAKMFSQSPLSSDGFNLNFINLLLILSKPFTGNFAKYHTFLPKINCFYLMTPDYLGLSAR
jgi:hypothetical protein